MCSCNLKSTTGPVETVSPTALGLRSTTFHLISNDADEGDIAIALSGTGLATGASSPFPLTGMTRLPNGSFRFGFTNQIGLPFTVLTATRSEEHRAGKEWRSR